MKPMKMPKKLTRSAAARIRMKASKLLTAKPDKDSAAGAAT